MPALLEDMGVDVVLGAATTKGHRDVADEEVLRGEGLSGVVGRAVVVTVQQGTLPGLAVGSAITVDGEAFTVRAPLAVDDGELVRLLCVKA